MTYKSFLVCILFLLAQFLGFAQTVNQQKDSLLAQINTVETKDKVLLYDSVSRLYWGVNPDSSLHYAKLAYEFAQKTGDKLSIGDAYNSLGNAYSALGNRDKALENYEQSLQHRQEGGDKLKVAYSLNNIALIYNEQNKYSEAINAYKEAASLCNELNKYDDEALMLIGIAETYNIINNKTNALEYAIKAASLFIHIDNKFGLAVAFNLIGHLHKDLNNNTLALEYYKKANQLYIELNNSYGIATTTNNLGIVHDELGQNDKALQYYQMFLQMAIESNNASSQGTAYNNIGFLYSKTKQYDKALDAYNKSLALSQSNNDSLSIMNTNNNIASTYLKMGQYNAAKKYVSTALLYTPSEPDLFFLAESHEILSKIYSTEKDYQKAYYHQLENKRINDSLFNMKATEQFVEMQVRFETERKEKEIELLKKNDEIKNLELQKQKNVNFLWIGLLLLFVGIGILGYFNLQQKKNSNKLLHEKNQQLEIANKKLIESEEHLTELNATKDRFFTIIAHDLKNPFNALLGFSELLNKNFDKYTKDQSKEIVETIHETSQNLYKLLENLLQWSRAQTGRITYTPELLPLHKVVKQEIELLTTLSEKKGLKIINRVEESIVVYADINLVSIIIRNLLSNAIKFCNPQGKITIAAAEQDNMVKVKVNDSGIGMSQNEVDKLFRLDESFSSKGTADEEGTGLGLIVCKEFVEMNGGTIYVSSQKDTGSTFTFTLPTSKRPANG